MAIPGININQAFPNYNPSRPMATPGSGPGGGTGLGRFLTSGYSTADTPSLDQLNLPALRASFAAAKAAGTPPVMGAPGSQNAMLSNFRASAMPAVPGPTAQQVGYNANQLASQLGSMTTRPGSVSGPVMTDYFPNLSSLINGQQSAQNPMYSNIAGAMQNAGTGFTLPPATRAYPQPVQRSSGYLQQ